MLHEFCRRKLVAFLCLLFLGFQWSYAQDLIQPAPDMPAYTLGSVHQGNDAFGRPSVTIDYHRAKEGAGLVSLSGKTSEGPLKIMGFGILHDASGKLELSSLFSGGRGLDVDLYLTVSGSFAEECPFQCLVSNIVQVGTPRGTPTTAREWNTKESAAYQKDLLGRKPPFAPPEGYQIVQGVTKLLAGMPVKVARYGEWMDAEALTNDALVTVKISGVKTLRTMTRGGWIAVQSSVLQQAASSPSSFQPSAKVIPGTTETLPVGYVIVTDAMKIVPGTPVKAIWHTQLSDATVIAVDGKQLTTHYDSQPAAFDKKLNRSSIVIAQSTLEELAKPDAAEQFESRIPKKSSFEEEMEEDSKRMAAEMKLARDELDRIFAENQKRMAPAGNFNGAGGLSTSPLPTSPLTVQNNPIDLPIPKVAEMLPLDIELPQGTKLAACWGQRWNYVTVLKDSTEETVPIHWDSQPTQFDGLIHRSQLIIRKIDLKKLRSKATRLAQRVWTDVTGKHSVEAKLSSRTDTHITLVKVDGKEVKLPIDKLSSADQKWLKDNP